MIEITHLKQVAMEKRVWSRLENGKNCIITEKIARKKARDQKTFVLEGKVLTQYTGLANHRKTLGQDCPFPSGGDLISTVFQYVQMYASELKLVMEVVIECIYLSRSKILVLWAYLSFVLDCRFNCHKRCASKVPKDCLGEVVFNGGKMRNMLSSTGKLLRLKKILQLYMSSTLTLLHVFILPFKFLHLRLLRIKISL